MMDANLPCIVGDDRQPTYIYVEDIYEKVIEEKPYESFPENIRLRERKTGSGSSEEVLRVPVGKIKISSFTREMMLASKADSDFVLIEYFDCSGRIIDSVKMIKER